MLAGSKPRIFTFLSATSDEEKSAMLVNLGASLARVGSAVLLLDASAGSRGVASRLDAARGATLVQVARRERNLDEVVQAMPQGFGVALMARAAQRSNTNGADQARRLANVFGSLAARSDIVVIDGELGEDGDFPISAMASGEIVVQVSTSAASIKSAYAIIKRLNAHLGRRAFSVLVTGASDREAQVVYQNIAQAASRYLALQLSSMGSVPADEHLKRAAKLGRSVVDAFPLAGASVAFRRLAGRFALSDLPASQLRAAPVSGASLGA